MTTKTDIIAWLIRRGYELVQESKEMVKLQPTYIDVAKTRRVWLNKDYFYCETRQHVNSRAWQAKYRGRYQDVTIQVGDTLSGIQFVT